MAKLFQKSDLPAGVKFTDGYSHERPFQILGLLQSHEFGDLICNVVFLSTLANQFDHVRLHVKFRDVRPYSRQIMSLSPWIDLAEPLGGEWPKWMGRFFPHAKPWRESLHIGSQKGAHVPLYDMIVTSLMARDESIHALPNPVPLRIPSNKTDELTSRLIAKGLNPHNWFAVIHHRESTYTYRPGGSDRDSDPKVFDELIDHIIGLGGQVVRLGHPEMTPFRPREGFVDLSRERDSLLLQAAAVSRARFAIAGPSGAIALALGFLIPSTLVDAVDGVGMWGPSDVLTHVVKTPFCRTLRNASLREAGLLDSHTLAEQMKSDPGYKIRKATVDELRTIADRLYNRTSDCRGWRSPAAAPEGLKPNHVAWPLRLSEPMPWVDL